MTIGILSSSMDDLARKLMSNLDRSRIFPPYYNKPEDLINLNSSHHVKRPPNGFLLCRKNVNREAGRYGICNMRVISKVTGMLWRDASPEEKNAYENLATQVNRLHSAKFPNYKYQPSSRARSSNVSTHLSSYQPYTIPQRPFPVASQTRVAYSQPTYYTDTLFQSFTPEEVTYLQFIPELNHELVAEQFPHHSHQL
ncbi:2750_t:CDS:1 [Acaulospora morrowiae]|uniref:2750_t:CDS:1 n=1 Tax=Acaulospora morrowiae TaxID=94023 RepID=A0A9N9FFP0_9GLOM|nr:2750_t:CDS:1 [Acaulospora morrowiae]